MLMSDGLDEVMAIHLIPLCVLAAVSDKEDPPPLPRLLCALLNGMTTAKSHL